MYISKLSRPYDYKVLIEAYLRTQGAGFDHPDFIGYYARLVKVLESALDVELKRDRFSFNQKVLWALFNGTVNSLCRIGTPWSGFLEEGLIVTKLEAAGERGEKILQASDRIGAATRESKENHYEMLYGLFELIYGEREKVISSAELLTVGFDDSLEPDIIDYYDEM